MCGEMATVSINMDQYNEDEVGVSVCVTSVVHLNWCGVTVDKGERGEGMKE